MSQFFINQIVFVVDKSPSAVGVSSVLKLPTKGPYKIAEIAQRNVTLIELETGKQIMTHIELLRPLDTTEFRLLLNKG